MAFFLVVKFGDRSGDPAHIQVEDAVGNRLDLVPAQVGDAIAAAFPTFFVQGALPGQLREVGAGLEIGHSVRIDLEPGRQAYVLAAHGRVSLDGVELALRDGAVIDYVEAFTIKALENSDVLVIDLPH